ncbi:hypothetical protein HMPREF0620_0555 [Parascardovia denticolens DSM 10105 = JCM 12538]|uniref:Uncharacterized protein n=1 Tax=Parascardovia denticolens DSM 10105 = JCM 12538 TaxID=864564 RepID=E6K169_PARDN|nr:hypothetical protein HMPREF0620_0555 [Parascardovia denticolens DSM 10105 = JCM 12538]
MSGFQSFPLLFQPGSLECNGMVKVDGEGDRQGKSKIPLELGGFQLG